MKNQPNTYHFCEEYLQNVLSDVRAAYTFLHTDRKLITAFSLPKTFASAKSWIADRMRENGVQAVTTLLPAMGKEVDRIFSLLTIPPNDRVANDYIESLEEIKLALGVLPDWLVDLVRELIAQYMLILLIDKDPIVLSDRGSTSMIRALQQGGIIKFGTAERIGRRLRGLTPELAEKLKGSTPCEECSHELPCSPVMIASQANVTVSQCHRALRTLLYSFYKLEVPYNEQQVQTALANWQAVEDDCAAWKFASKRFQPVLRPARSLLKAVLGSFDWRDITPRHGPGAVSTGEKYETKWVFTHFYNDLHQSYPYYDYMYGRSSDLAGTAKHLETYTKMDRSQEPTSKLVFVPKDSRGPRTICCEPLEIQWIQGGVSERLMTHIEHHPLTRGHVNFEDQSINGRLALEGSTGGSISTIDLKDASDRVPLAILEELFPNSSLRYLRATRSTHCRLPDGQVVELKKYAPMGSALCFPIESLLFWALCVAALEAQGCRISEALASVWVYGDDIIIRHPDAGLVMDCLEQFNLKVNRDKSFTSGFFRESCGIDAFNGHLVTPVRVKKMPPRSRSDGAALAAWVDYSNNLFEIGLFNASEYIERYITEIVGHLPVTSAKTSYLSYVRPYGQWDLEGYPFARWNAALQHAEVKVLVVSPRPRNTTLDGVARLTRALTMPVRDGDPNRLVVRDATQTRLKWCPFTP